MLTYNDLYEIMRKEKYSEALQALPKNFLSDVALYLHEQRAQPAPEGDLFSDSITKLKKQLENFIAIFKELVLRRKKKLLNLAFVATETGIMKRDYETMLGFERGLFEQFVKSFEDADKELASILHGKKDREIERNRMILFSTDVEQFVDMNGALVGPFKVGALANIEAEVAEVLVGGGKANYVDEE